MGLMIFGGILLLVLILLTLSLSFELNVENQADFKIRYAFFSILPGKNKKTQNKKRKPEKSKNTTVNKKKPKKKLRTKTGARKLSTAPPKSKSAKTKQKVDFIMIKSVIDSIPFKRLISKIRIKELYIRSISAGNDAAKTAISYGINCAVISTALQWLDTTMKVSVKDIPVKADFEEKESDFFLHCKIKIRVITLIVCLAAFLKKYLNNNEPPKKETPKKEGSKDGGTFTGTDERFNGENKTTR